MWFQWCCVLKVIEWIKPNMCQIKVKISAETGPYNSNCFKKKKNNMTYIFGVQKNKAKKAKEKKRKDVACDIRFLF